MKDNAHLYTDHFRELLLRCGEHITTLDISHQVSDLSPDRTLHIISKHCKNLHHLNISQLQIKRGGLVSIGNDIAPKLKSLHMDRKLNIFHCNRAMYWKYYNHFIIFF